jgi:hypothetical protein
VSTSRPCCIQLVNLSDDEADKNRLIAEIDIPKTADERITARGAKRPFIRKRHLVADNE